MKLNWGYKIMVVYGIFVLGILFLVFKSTQQKYDLVQQDYYAQELKYQEVINASQNAKNIGGSIKLLQNSDSLKIVLPTAFKSKLTKGIAHLYFAADERKDITKNFVSDSGDFTMNISTVRPGTYTLKLNVTMNGEAYYYEQKLSIK